MNRKVNETLAIAYFNSWRFSKPSSSCINTATPSSPRAFCIRLNGGYNSYNNQRSYKNLVQTTGHYRNMSDTIIFDNWKALI